MSNSSSRNNGKAQSLHIDLDGVAWNLALLDREERALFDELERRYAAGADWSDFDNYIG